MIPKKSSFRHKVAEALYEAGGSMTIRDCAEKLSHTDYRGLQTVFINMKSSGQLTQRGNVYTLSNAVKRYFDSAALQCDDEPGEIVQPRTSSAFKPLSDKHKFWLGLRREPLREVSFINGGCEYRQLGEPA